MYHTGRRCIDRHFSLFLICMCIVLSGFTREWALNSADRAQKAGFGIYMKFVKPSSVSSAGSSRAEDSSAASLLLVGVENTTGNASQSGKVEVYSLENQNSWTPSQTLQADAPPRQSRFGAAGATVGTDILVGAFGQDSFAGQVEIFRRGAYGYVQIQSLRPSNVVAANQFGLAVAAVADRAAVGAPNSSLAESRGGAVYCYELTPGGWVEKQTIIPNDLEANDEFGAVLAMTDTWCFARGFGGTFTGGRSIATNGMELSESSSKRSTFLANTL